MTALTRTDQSIIGQWWWTVDRTMLACFTALIAFGVVLVAAASPPVAERIGLNEYHFLIRHLVYLVPATCLMVGTSILEPRMIWRLGLLTMAGCLISMVYILFAGAEIKGAQRWLHLPGFSIQPSEFVKPAFAVIAAWLISRQKENPAFRGMTFSSVLFLMTVILLLLQPDMGMTIIMTCIFGAQMFLAGLPLRYVAGLGLIALLGMVMMYFTFDHVQSRIDRFLDPASGDTYQVQRSLEAFREGGIFGTGPGQGMVKLNIPDAHADFIFAVAGEELGALFVLSIVGLFAYIVLRGFNKLMDSHDMFVVLAVGGVLVMFGMQALVHMGSALQLLPTKGMTLPFISYGGSSLLATGMAAGIVLGLTRRRRRGGIARTGLSRMATG